LKFLRIFHKFLEIFKTDEMPLLLAPMDKFGTPIYAIGNFLSISLHERIGLRNVMIWLHRMDSFSLLVELFAWAELEPAF
jgi:hypothetical protein